MLGSASDAEDIVQEAFLHFHRESVKGTQIDSPQAYLSAITTRLSIDHRRSARVRRERYTGTWLPEPFITDEEPDVAEHAETADSLSTAFLVLFESLTPVERASSCSGRCSTPATTRSRPSSERVRTTAARSPSALAVRSMRRGHASRPRGSGEKSSLGGLRSGDHPDAAALADLLVQTVRAIANPEKLRHLGTFTDPQHEET